MSDHSYFIQTTIKIFIEFSRDLTNVTHEFDFSFSKYSCIFVALFFTTVSSCCSIKFYSRFSITDRFACLHFFWRNLSTNVFLWSFKLFRALNCNWCFSNVFSFLITTEHDHSTMSFFHFFSLLLDRVSLNQKNSRVHFSKTRCWLNWRNSMWWLIHELDCWMNVLEFVLLSNSFFSRFYDVEHNQKIDRDLFCFVVRQRVAIDSEWHKTSA